MTDRVSGKTLHMIQHGKLIIDGDCEAIKTAEMNQYIILIWNFDEQKPY